MVSIKYENIVAFLTVKGQLDLSAISENLPGSQYDPDVFPGLMYHQSNPKSVIFLFRSGKLQITGPNSYDQLNEAIDSFISRVKRAGFILSRASPVETKDIAASLELGKHIDLNLLSDKLGSLASYDPRSFPSLVYKPGPKIQVLVFENGKIVSTGTRNSEETKKAFEAIIKKA